MIEKLSLPPDVCYAIQSKYQHAHKFYDKQAAIAYEGEAPGYPIAKRSPFDRAVILCCCLDALYEKYKATGLPEEIIWDTFSDISFRLRLYYEKHGKIGLSIEDVIWFRHLWYCEIFQIGSLQFHKFHMLYLDSEGIGEDYVKFQNKPIPEKTPVWNVHVPRGTDLSYEAVIKSMSQATMLLRSIFPEHQADYFLCYSWLLYPGLKILLPKGSNILAFADQFTVIGSVQDPAEAVSCIYGRRYPRKSLYPQETHLQKQALGSFSQLGYSCGLRKMDIT